MPAPLSVGEMFETVVRLIGRTFVRSLMLGAALLAGPTLLLGFSWSGIADSLGPILEQSAADPTATPNLALLLGSLGIIAVAVTLFIVCTLLMRVAMMRLMCADMEDETMDWVVAIKDAFSLRTLKLVGAWILIGLLAIAALTVPIIGIAAIDPIVGVFVTLLLFPLGFWLAIRWIFMSQAIVWEDADVLQSFSRSAYLVDGFWWRIFGLFILFSIASQMALSIILTPVSFIAMGGFMASYFALLVDMGPDATPDPAMIQDMISSIGIGMVIFVMLSILLTSIVETAYQVVIYFDTRARKGEFSQPAPPAEGEALDFNAIS